MRQAETKQYRDTEDQHAYLRTSTVTSASSTEHLQYSIRRESLPLPASEAESFLVPASDDQLARLLAPGLTWCQSMLKGFIEFVHKRSTLFR